MSNNIKNLYNQLLTLESEMNNLHLKGFKNFEEYLLYSDKIQELRTSKATTIKNLYNELNSNIKDYYTTTYTTGVVWTKFEEDILKGRFLMYIDKGRSIDHKFIDIA